MSRSQSTYIKYAIPWVLLLYGKAYALDLPSASINNGTSPSSKEDTLTAKKQAEVILYADGDSLGNRSIYLHGTLSPISGIYESGIRFRLAATSSWYRYPNSDTGNSLNSGHSIDSDFLAGYAFAGSRIRATWLAGPTFNKSVNEGVTTERWGAKMLIELFGKPTDQTMMAGSVSYSTFENKLEIQTRAGLRLSTNQYIGPEAKFTWERLLPWQIHFGNIVKLRAGAHLSTIDVGPFEMSASGGWSFNQQLGSGYYGSVNIYKPF